MSKRAHADEIIKWSSDKDAVVFCRNSTTISGEPEWYPTEGVPLWFPTLQYKTILPEYAEAWQAWLDGELQIRDETGWFAWFAVDDDDVPGFDLDPEEYRRIPKEPECNAEAEQLTELAELKAQHKLALEGWEREKNERMRLEEIAAEFDEQSKTNDHLSAMLTACKSEMERPAAGSARSHVFDLEDLHRENADPYPIVVPEGYTVTGYSVADGLRKLLAARDESLKERDSELMAANARAEYWKRQALNKPTSDGSPPKPGHNGAVESSVEQS